jgi:hypothetical protein
MLNLVKNVIVDSINVSLNVILTFEIEFDVRRNSTKALSQYDLYRYKSIQEALDSNTWSIQLTENSVTPYNNDWIVQQNV